MRVHLAPVLRVVRAAPARPALRVVRAAPARPALRVVRVVPAHRAALRVLPALRVLRAALNPNDRRSFLAREISAPAPVLGVA